MITVTQSLCLVVVCVAVAEALPAKRETRAGPPAFSRRRRVEEDYELFWTLPRLMALKKRFQMFLDPNDDCKATFDEAKSFLQKYSPDVSEAKIRKFMERRDTNGDGVLEFVPEYIVHMSLPDYTIEGATEWFDLEDSNHDGVVSRAELLRIAQNVGLGEEEAAQTVDGYYMDADMNGDNVLDWEEYKKLYNL
ncbi:uncharacterized protein LOC135479532 [Liolophura sinensis]|uniref:uncharacterized protein LOC135479532 n=1 Tax=Liolophura sinensis TaxID=3198878 RepID=UPI0031588A3D